MRPLKDRGRPWTLRDVGSTYDYEKTVGEGVYGEVFQATEKLTKDARALKRVKTDNATTEGWLHLNATRPGDSLEWAWRVAATPAGPQGPQESPGKQHANVELLDARWKDEETLQVWLPGEKECARVLVFSV